MNKDQVEGKLKDVVGRAERQVGEWAGDTEKQAHGTVKQVEGKVQNAWGNVIEAGEEAAGRTAPDKKDDSVDKAEADREKDVRSQQKAS